MAISIFVDEAECIHFLKEGKELLTVAETPDEKTGRLILTLSGMLNLETLPALYAELAALVSVGEKLTLNLSGLTYFARSEGASVLTRIQRQIEELDEDESLVLSDVPPEIMKELQAVGATALLEIEKKRG